MVVMGDEDESPPPPPAPAPPWGHHGGHIWCQVSLSGDAQRIAGGDAKGDVVVYDFSAECEIFSWRDSNQVVRAHRPSSSRRLTPPPRRWIQPPAPPTHEQRKRSRLNPPKNSNQVYGVALSHDGAALAVCGSSKSARIFHVATGAEMYHRIAADRLRACAISADGSLMAVGGFDARLNVCNMHEGARLHSVEQHEVSVSEVIVRSFGGRSEGGGAALLGRAARGHSGHRVSRKGVRLLTQILYPFFPR